MKDIYITFYDVGEKYTTIYNGFSFGRDTSTDYLDIYFSERDDTDSIKAIINSIDGVRKIWCSVTTCSHFLRIMPIVDDRWIVGGPFVNFIKSIPEVESKVQHLNCEMYAGQMENYLGKDVSSNFDFYFEDLVRTFEGEQIVISSNIGSGCYWNRCTFCNFNNYSWPKFLRPNIEKIISSLPESPFHGKIVGCHLCMSSTPPEILGRVVKAKKKSTILALYVRADDFIIEEVKKYDDLSGFSFSIGLEGLAQSVIDNLDKGVKIDSILELTELLLKKNSVVRLNLMTNHIYKDYSVVDESKNVLLKIKTFREKYRNLVIRMHGPILFLSKQTAEKYGPHECYTDGLVDYYINILSDEQKHYNNIIDKEMKKITPFVRRFDYFNVPSLVKKEVSI
jgi:hypothetical protein